MSEPEGEPSRPSELTADGLAALGPATACDTEPIHLSGAVQPVGFLLAVRPDTLEVVVASRNVEEFLGTGVDDVLGRPLPDVLGPAIAGTVAQVMVHDLLEPEVVTVSLPVGPMGQRRADLTVHRSDGLVVCEIEPSSAISDEAVVGFYQAVNQAMSRLHRQPDVDGLVTAAVTELRVLTGYDRVMVYRFDDDAHGEVVAEARRPDAEPFLGLHYPAGDIPRQARRLYLRNWLRVLADADDVPSPLVARPGAVPEAGLDLSLSALRSMSPIHLQYLRNMGVRATLTISLIVEGRLWGMVACHHDTPRRVSGHLRAACMTFGQTLALQLRTATAMAAHDYAAQLARHSAQVVSALTAAETLSLGVCSVPEALLGMVGADGAVLSIGGRRTTVGAVPEDAVLDVVEEAVRQHTGDRREPFADAAVARLCRARLSDEELARNGVTEEAVSARAAGVLFLPLGQTPGDYLMWLRGERARDVRWAGQEAAERATGATHALSPRASFTEWREQVRGLSLPWQQVERDAAAELGQAYPELVLHRSRTRLMRLALYDPLTGLPNRTMLLERLSGELSAADGTWGRILAVMIFDLDDFTQVNAMHGHAAGDELLTTLAQRLSSSLRSDDVLARIAGDTFALLIPSVTGVEQAVGIARRLVDRCRIAFPLSPEVSVEVSLSVGVALHHGDGDAVELLRRADNAVYHAKRIGRGQIRVYGMDREVETGESRLETKLDRALAAGELTVHLQPVVRLDAGGPGTGGEYYGGVLEGAEALVRWQHPDGTIPPDRFVPLAERTGQIHALGEYVLERALREVACWPAPDLRCAVNVSAAELGRAGFAASVLRRLARHGVSPDRLCLEVTETQMMERPEDVAGVLAELREAGVRIAIDDFGTGYSSLAYVRSLPAHLLKIDRTFVAGLPDSARDVAVVASVVRLAHEMGMEVVAEGVETPEQLAALRGLGCEYAQGYLLGRPMPAADFGAAVARSLTQG